MYDSATISCFSLIYGSMCFLHFLLICNGQKRITVLPVGEYLISVTFKMIKKLSTIQEWTVKGKFTFVFTISFLITVNDIWSLITNINNKLDKLQNNNSLDPMRVVRSVYAFHMPDILTVQALYKMKWYRIVQPLVC